MTACDPREMLSAAGEVTGSVSLDADMCCPGLCVTRATEFPGANDTALLGQGQHQQADAAINSAGSNSTWQLPWGTAAAAGSCPPPVSCDRSGEMPPAAVQPLQRQRCGYGGQPGVWLFPPELEPNVTLWDSKYKALDPECEPQPLVQHYIARQRMAANSTGPTEELLDWTKREVRLDVHRLCLLFAAASGTHVSAVLVMAGTALFCAAHACLLSWAFAWQSWRPGNS